ncbi:MAG: rane protein [Oscillospiraceae bacterium]|nr:rane protein [Oscillospiraceae bacterium]
MNQNNKTSFLVQFSILLAIEAIFCFTPFGSLPAIGPIVATLAMIPVVITAVLLGTKAGTMMGAFTGLFSFLVWTFTPPSPLVAFIFTPFYSLGEFSGNFGSLIICFVPRILTGTVAGLAYQALSRTFPRKNVLCFSLSAILGSLTNTFGVMGGIWLFFGNQYASIMGEAMLLIIGMTILTSGIPEAIVNAVVTSAVCKPMNMILGKKGQGRTY